MLSEGYLKRGTYHRRTCMNSFTRDGRKFLIPQVFPEKQVTAYSCFKALGIGLWTRFLLAEFSRWRRPFLAAPSSCSSSLSRRSPSCATGAAPGAGATCPGATGSSPSRDCSWGTPTCSSSRGHPAAGSPLRCAKYYYVFSWHPVECSTKSSSFLSR